MKDNLYWKYKFKKYSKILIIIAVLLIVGAYYGLKPKPKMVKYEQTLTIIRAQEHQVVVWKDNGYWDVTHANSFVDSLERGDKIRCVIEYEEGNYEDARKHIRYLYKVKK